MKNHKLIPLTYLLAVCCLGLVSCLNTTDKEKAGMEAHGSAVNRPDSTKLTTIQWLDSSQSLGNIAEGQVVKIKYRFKNSGNKPLVIERVQPGCGCTVADYPKQPIAPGSESEILAEFNSKGKEGLQKKNITVFANTAEYSTTLWFEVTINGSAKK